MDIQDMINKLKQIRKEQENATFSTPVEIGLSGGGSDEIEDIYYDEDKGKIIIT